MENLLTIKQELEELIEQFNITELNKKYKEKLISSSNDKNRNEEYKKLLYFLNLLNVNLIKYNYLKIKCYNPDVGVNLPDIEYDEYYYYNYLSIIQIQNIKIKIEINGVYDNPIYRIRFHINEKFMDFQEFFGNYSEDEWKDLKEIFNSDEFVRDCINKDLYCGMCIDFQQIVCLVVSWYLPKEINF